ncbi:hypothetical protein JW998_00380 [candidate division KSB1 bacterium]|nr:hypothetical protein [candidate division KSB1 bacterium]
MKNKYAIRVALWMMGLALSVTPRTAGLMLNEEIGDLIDAMEAEAFALVSGGVRFFGDRIAVDLAIVTSDQFRSEDGFPFLPWVDFPVLFGK